MHGLMNRAVEGFIRDTYGEEIWLEISSEARLGFTSFEAMLHYDDVVTKRLIEAAALRLTRTKGSFLEDLGTYLVSHHKMESLRRLLRFGGTSFVDFLYSLEDLPDRTRLAVPDLRLPDLVLSGDPTEGFTLNVIGTPDGFGRVMVGILRAMADDYGALALLDHKTEEGVEIVAINVHDQKFNEGRDFQLSAPVA